MCRSAGDVGLCGGVASGLSEEAIWAQPVQGQERDTGPACKAHMTAQQP